MGPNYPFNARSSFIVFVDLGSPAQENAGPRSAVGNVSVYRGREFDPGPVPYFVEIDHEMFSTVILLPSADSFKKVCCQLQAKVCARITG